MTIPGNLQRRPFLAPIGAAALAAIAGMLILIAAVWLMVTSTSTTVIVVRHAPEILGGGGGGDPPLSAEGEARAAALARTLGDTHLESRVRAIYVSDKLRNRSTAAPLAQILGITPEVVPEDDARALARRVLHEHSGDTVLIVAHANTLPSIVSRLSGVEDIPEVDPSDYATLYVVSVPRIGRSRVIRLRY